MMARDGRSPAGASRPASAPDAKGSGRAEASTDSRADSRPAGRRPSTPVQEFFSIGEVCALTGLKPHVLRYWESQFRVLSPAKNRSGNRVYQRREVELVMLVKQLLYEEKYTIDGARQRLGELRRAKTLRTEAAGAFKSRLASELEGELQQILEILEGSGTENES